MCCCGGDVAHITNDALTVLPGHPPEVPEWITPPEPTTGRHRIRGIALFFFLATLYFGVGSLLVLRYNLFEGDAASRVANAGYVLMSRDPHLSAIGFVWNPLPSLVEIPILLFARWWPELRTYGLAGVLQSALFMAGSTLVVRTIALDRGLGSGWRRVAITCFALQPMIVVYGASGMSEAAETFCLLWCVRHLMRWSDQRSIADLAWAGIALGVGYLARYEVVPAALSVVVFVAVVSASRAAAQVRISTMFANVGIVVFPIAHLVMIWAVTGWVVNHELFATLTSQYGNGMQVADVVRRGRLVRDSPTAWVVISARLLGMQPFVGIAASGAAVYAALTRKPTPLVPVVAFGPVLAFAGWGQYSATTFGFFRYFLLAIPLVVCIALACWTPSPGPRLPWTVETPANRLAAALLCGSVLIGYPVTVRAMLNDHIDNPPLQAGFNSLLHPARFPPSELPDRRLMVDDRLLADYLDSERLPDGAVLMDSAYTWGTWLSSDNPKQFVITGDYDFKAALNRPWNYQVKYLLVSNPSITGSDALNVRYPTLWNDGAGFSRLVYSIYGIYGAAGDELFRLYQVTGAPRTVLSPPR